MNSAEIRSLFYSFFEKKKHYKVLSSSLVPAKDPTLLFTNAGMNQFKGIFLGNEKRDYSKAVSIQKCMRVSGKHNDFDEVGRTDFHHTFFEMLGNFSFGDYFKEEAISLAWELMTEYFQFEKDKLWISVFEKDDDAYRIWEEKIGVPSERIVRLGEKDNFWQMGDTGPCGPCSEIHVDRGEKFGPPDFFDGNSRFVEIWNLVFMQYFKNKEGTLIPLPSPSIDTGMGMERLTALLSGVKSNYETDLFRPIIERVAEMSGLDPDDEKNRVAFNVIADHVRALSFLISDGVLPSNDGRGYVLRRLLRRASKHGRTLGFKEDFLFKISDTAVDIMKDSYPELLYNRSFISEVIRSEEERFQRTLSRGLKLFLEILDSTEKKGADMIPGEDLFKLSDTYGFPLDFSIDLAKERDIGVDIEGFDRELSAQKEKSRSQLKSQRNFSGRSDMFDKYRSEFTGYEKIEFDSTILAVFDDNSEITSLSEGEEGVMITKKTPFYGESGGQSGDKGTGAGENFFCSVQDSKKSPGGNVLHYIRIEKGSLKKGDQIKLKVNGSLRKDITVHHTCTHMLQAALREVLGLHVKQSGSYVGPDKLRFDFTHYKALKKEEIADVEILVNNKIRENIPVKIEENSYEEAIDRGAMAIFEEKYSDKVRVVSLDDFSMELCGGTHLKNSGEAGYFKILNESSIASGIRRIEAVAGKPCDGYIRSMDSVLSLLEDRFKQKREKLPEHLSKIFKDMKGKNREKDINKTSVIDMKKIAVSGFDLEGYNVFINFVENANPSELSSASDSIIRDGGDINVLCTNLDDKSKMVASVGKNLTKKVDASRLIKDIAEIVKGNGGGRKDFAQAGGVRIEDPDGFISDVITIVKKHLNE